MKRIQIGESGQKQSCLTAGELAKMSHINRDTLTFYIRYGLIKPDFVADNGYKYFLPEKIMTVNFIRYFRNLDFSLESIVNMLEEFRNSKETFDYSDILKRQKEHLENKLDELERSLKFITWKNCFLDYLDRHPKDQIFFDELPETSLYISPVHFCQSMNDPENARLLSDFFTDSNGEFSVPVRPICCVMERKPFAMNGLMVDEEHRVMPAILTESSTRNRICTRPAGRYACLIHSGGNVTVHRSVMRILGYLAENQIPVTGNGFVINSRDFLNVTDSQSAGYIIQVELQQN